MRTLIWSYETIFWSMKEWFNKFYLWYLLKEGFSTWGTFNPQESATLSMEVGRYKPCYETYGIWFLRQINYLILDHKYWIRRKNSIFYLKVSIFDQKISIFEILYQCEKAKSLEKKSVNSKFKISCILYYDLGVRWAKLI